MKIEDCMELLEWLSGIYPKRFSPRMNEARRDALLEVFEYSFKRFDIEQVKGAYKAIMQTQADAPEIADVLAHIKNTQERKEKTEQPNYDDLPWDHPYKGCYYHEEALNAYVADDKAGKRNGRRYSDYCKAYPAVVWKPWSNPSINTDRIDDPTGAWHYMKGKTFTGWRTNEKGFCVPTCK